MRATGLMLALLPATSPVLAYQSQVMEFDITPQPAVVGFTVTISGWVVPDADSNTVDVRIDKPPGYQGDRRKIVDETTCDENGLFTWSWGPLDYPGTWHVYLKGPHDPELAEDDFVVEPAQVAIITVSRGIAEAIPPEQEANQLFMDSAAKYPATPGQEAALSSAQEAAASLGQARTVAEQFQQALEDLANASQGLPPMPATMQAIEQGAQVMADASSSVEPQKAQLVDKIQQTRSAAEWCEHWCFQGECLKQTVDLLASVESAMKNVASWAGKQFQTAVENDYKKLVEDVAWEGYTDAQKAKMEKARNDCLLAVSVIDSAAKDFADISTPVQTLTKNAIDWVIGDVTKNCEKYTGPIKGRMVIDYYLKGKPYMRARYKVDGNVYLFFEKREGEGDLVSVSGKIIGQCSNFIGSMDLKHVVNGLPGTDYVAFGIPRWVPKDFLIEIEGEVHPDKMKLKFVRPAFRDFEEVKYRYCVVLFSLFQTNPIPDFPETRVPGAEWYLTRVTGTAGDEPYFEVPLNVTGDQTRAEKEFSRTMDYIDENQFEGRLTLDFKACSPPCK